MRASRLIYTFLFDLFLSSILRLASLSSLLTMVSWHRRSAVLAWYNLASSSDTARLRKRCVNTTKGRQKTTKSSPFSRFRVGCAVGSSFLLPKSGVAFACHCGDKWVSTTDRCTIYVMFRAGWYQPILARLPRLVLIRLLQTRLPLNFASPKRHRSASTVKRHSQISILLVTMATFIWPDVCRTVFASNVSPLPGSRIF